MHFKILLPRFIVIVLLAGFCITSVYSQSASEKNVVIVLVDDLGWKDLGYAGSVLYKTPHLDELAKEATVFTQAYSGHPVCSPSRAAIMTGKNPTRLGITDWIPGQRPDNRPLTSPPIRNELTLEEKTMAEYFQEAGYKTFFAGKWHLGGVGHTPEDQGFEINIGGIDKGSPPGGYYAPYKNSKLPDGPEGEYLTDRLTDETIRFIRQNQNNKFFAFLSFYTVHTPIQASLSDREQYNDLSIPVIKYPEGDGHTLLHQSNLDYASMVSAMDRNVGKLIESLKETGLWENTVFVFTSDNGGLSTLERNRTAPTSNQPLRAGKGWCYEGGIRIPQIIHFPNQSGQPATFDQATVHQDLLPTIWNSAGHDDADLMKIDGVNILRNYDSSNRKLFWDYPHYHGSGWTPGGSVRKGDWKIIYWYEGEELELYNLKEDPLESVDLSEKFPDKANDLKKELDELITENNGQFPKVNPEYEGQNE